MGEKKALAVNDYTRILVPAESYNLSGDKRLLIPFTSGEHIGFINREGEVVVEPKYNMYYGECYNENDLIKVATIEPYGFQRSENKVAAYKRPMYGIIDYQGKIMIEPKNYSLIFSKKGNVMLFTIQREDYSYGVINIKGEEIIPFGKYHWIDGFYRGFARVKMGGVSNGNVGNENKWGVINESGEEVVPCIYSNIWNFYEKDYETIIAEDEKSRKYISFDSLVKKIDSKRDPSYDTYEERPTYNEYNGSYAQDVMGYSDQLIDDVFEGDPDAYWNID